MRTNPALDTLPKITVVGKKSTVQNCLRLSSASYSSTLKVETGGSSETIVSIYQTYKASHYRRW
jgi:hypothetical protein